MKIVFCETTKENINELIQSKIAYIIDSYGSITEHEKRCLEKQLTDYFERGLGNEWIIFTAKDVKQIVSIAYLHIIGMLADLTITWESFKRLYETW